MSTYRPHIVLYSHDTFGLGHPRINLAISPQLAHDSPQLSQLLVTGSPQAHHYRFPSELDYIKLPAIQKRAGGDYGARTLDVNFASMVRWRANMILQAVREFKPDILLVDKAPAGMRGHYEHLFAPCPNPGGYRRVTFHDRTEVCFARSRWDGSRA